MAKSSFGKAFAAARKAKGAGETFVWLESEGGDGKTYSTNIAGEGKSKPKEFSVDMAKKAIDKAVGPKPQRRPAMSTSEDAPMRTSPSPKKKPTDLMSTSSVSTPKVTTTFLPHVQKNTSPMVRGRGGYASGPASGMPSAKPTKETPAAREKRIASASPLGQIMDWLTSPSKPAVRAIAKPVKPKTNSTSASSRKDAIAELMKTRKK